MGLIAKKLDIEYVHMPELGIRSQDRVHLKTAEDYERLFDQYETGLGDVTVAVDEAARYVGDQPTVLVCMEKLPSCCHRSRLAREIANRTHLPVCHIQ